MPLKLAPFITDPETQLRSLAREADAASADPAGEIPAVCAEEWRPGAGREEAGDASSEGAPQAPGSSAPSEMSPETISASPAVAPSPEPSSPALPTPEAEAEARRAEFERAWQQAVAEETERSPELKEGSSALSRGVQQILQETPLFTATPDGFRQAARLARAQSQAAAIPQLQARIDSLTKENQRLARLTSITSITGSPPARPSHAPEELSERDLRRMAQEVDAGFYA